tara:strand:+ start:522 stop:845 length:324 start_codon:yes stop_codon:yes gene_type:complete
MNKIIKNTNTIIDLTITMISHCHDDLEIDVISDEKTVNGKPGVDIRIKWMGIVKKEFITFSFCEDILLWGQLLAKEYINTTFRYDINKIAKMEKRKEIIEKVKKWKK